MFKLVEKLISDFPLWINHTGENRYRRIQDTALVYAIQNGHTDVVKLLMEHYASWSKTTCPLAEAAKHGHLEICKLLFENKQYYNHIQSIDKAIDAAITNGHTDTAKFLINEEIPLELEDKRQPESSLSLLHRAVEKNNTDVFHALLQKAGDINMESIDEKGNTCLHKAVEHRSEGIVNYYLAYRPSVFLKKNNKGLIPLDIDSSKEVLEKIYAFHEAKGFADIDDTQRLKAEVRLDKLDKVKERFELLDVRQAISLAVDSRSKETLNYLLEKISSDNLLKNEDIPKLVSTDQLHSLIENNEYEILKLVMDAWKKHTKIDAKTQTQLLPKMIYRKGQHSVDSVSCLSLAANSHHSDKDANAKIIKLLLEAGCSTDLDDPKKPYPPIISAAINKNGPAVKVFLNAKEHVEALSAMRIPDSDLQITDAQRFIVKAELDLYMEQLKSQRQSPQKPRFFASWFQSSRSTQKQLELAEELFNAINVGVDKNQLFREYGHALSSSDHPLAEIYDKTCKLNMIIDKRENFNTPEPSIEESTSTPTQHP